jgi:hypothetical protein
MIKIQTASRRLKNGHVYVIKRRLKVKKAWVVTVASVIIVAFALPVYGISRSSPAAQEAVTGDWAAETQETPRGTVLSIFLNNNNNITGWDHLQMSVVTPLRDFTGLNPGVGANAQFSLRREAGTIAFTGLFKNNRGIGEFRFQPNGGFVRTMWDLGYEGLTTEKLFVMTVHNIGAGYISELKALGYDKVPLNILIAMRVHAVDGQFIHDVEKMGFAKLSASKLIALRINGLSNEQIQSALALGDDDIPPSKLLEMWRYGVDAEFIKEMGEAGYSNLKPDTLILLRRFGVDAHFVKEMRDAGYTDLSIRNLIKLRIKGVKRGRGRNVFGLGR